MDIIVSRYAKDVSWTKQLTDCNVIIYDKSDDENDYIKLPNIGREPHTFIHHIINNYNNLPDYSCFIQDNPFDHVGANDFSFIRNFKFDADFTEIGKSQIRWDLNGGPTFSWLDIKYLFWNKYFINHPNEIIFAVGGQFIVSKSAILLRKKVFYEELMLDINRTDIPVPYGKNVGHNKIPWILEAVWKYIFNKEFKSKYDN